MSTWFSIYIYVYACAVIESCFFFYDLYFSKKSEEIMSDARDLANMINADVRFVIVFVMMLVALFGWILLPLKIAASIIDWFSNDKQD